MSSSPQRLPADRSVFPPAGQTIPKPTEGGQTSDLSVLRALYRYIFAEAVFSLPENFEKSSLFL